MTESKNLADATEATPHAAGEAVTLASQVHRLALSFTMPDMKPADELKAADALYAKAGPEAVGLVDTTARRLLQQTALFANMNFLSSLVRGSPFFGAVLCRMQAVIDGGETVDEDVRMTVMVRMSEYHRRGKRYDEMNASVTRVRTELGTRVTEGEPAANKIVSKVVYEAHMAAYQQGEEAEGADRKEEAAGHYARSVALAEASAAHAAVGNDRPGQLFALNNIATLLLPKLGKPEEAIAAAIAIAAEAQGIADGLPDDADHAEDRLRALRTVMNAQLHAVDIAVQIGHPTAAVAVWMAALERNPVYGQTDSPNVGRIVDAAKAYLEPSA